MGGLAIKGSDDVLREHLRQDVSVHGIITKGGDRVNVVPEFGQAEFAVRALDTVTMEAAASEEGWKAAVIAGKAIALSAYELLTNPEKVKEIQEKFKALKSTK